jgi:plastocyanin
MKSIIILIVVAIAGVLGYLWYSGMAPTAEGPAPVVVEEVDVEATPVSPEEVDTETEGETETPETPAALAEDKGPTEESTVKAFTLDSFNYGYSMDTIEVNEGDTVTITLTNSGGFHDWVLDEFGAATEKINPGEETSVTFVADQAGTYEYYCSVGSHRARCMVGTLIVN